MKLFLQFIFALIIVIWSNTINNNDFYVNNLTIPFFKNFILNLGIFYTIFRIIVIIGASNAVNITDGLDGLAIMPVIFNSFVLIIFCYFSGHAIYSKYLWLYHINNAGEICVFLSALIGASLGFLWFNAKPAEIFMGDSGSLAIGATLGTIAIITKNEILLAIIGGLFVIEAMSVIIQVCYFKLTKKRFFKMAPIHHHFEKIGWSETKVVIRFWIISLIFSLIGLLSLKLR